MLVDTTYDGCTSMTQPRRKRLKVVLYNPRAVFFTMPLALLAIGSELDPDIYEVVIIDARASIDVLSRMSAGALGRCDGARTRRRDIRRNR